MKDSIASIRKAAGLLSKAVAKKSDSWERYESHDADTIEAAREIANLLADMAAWNQQCCMEFMEAFTLRNEGEDEA